MSRQPIRHPVRTLHVLSSLDPEYGGPVAALKTMASALTDVCSVDVCGLTYRPETEAADDFGPSAWVQAFPVADPSRKHSLQHSRPLQAWLRRHAAEYDTVFVHGVFDAVSLGAMYVCKATKGARWTLRPYGCLDPYDLRKHRWAKAAIGQTFLKRTLPSAASIWCTTSAEATRLVGFGSCSPRAVVPLPVEPFPPSSGARVDRRAQWGISRSDRVLLFLSRITPKKRLENVIRALGTPSLAQVHLVVAGTGDSSYVATLRELARALGVGARVHWVGWASPQDRQDLFAASDVFVLSSENENFGVAAAEAAAAGLPSVLTEETFVAPGLAEVGGAVITSGDPRDIGVQVGRLLDSEGLHRTVGRQAHEYWRSHWSAAAFAHSFEEELLRGRS